MALSAKKAKAEAGTVLHIEDSKFRYTLREMGRNKGAYMMMAPFMILFLIFTLLPVLLSLPIGFTNFNMVQFPKWVGLSNFYRLFLEDDVFLIAIKNTLIFAFLTGPLSYFLCFILAWLINQMGAVLKTIFTFIFYAPSFAGNIYFIWQLMFSGDANGYINATLMDLGIISAPIQWLTDANYMLPIVIIVQLWLSLGAGFLSFIAGLQSVDKSMYEAGAVEGIKNRWQELLHITLPSMGPQLLFAAVMQITSSFTVGTVAQALTGLPSTDYATHTIMSHAMDYGSLRYEMGYASAICFVLFIAMLLMNQLINRILRKYTSD